MIHIMVYCLKVNELSATVKEQHTEMKQRIMTLESSLQKYELEIQERTKQVGCHDYDSLH